MKCYLQTTMLHIHSAEARPKAKSQEKPGSKSQTKSQEPSEAKSQKPKAQCQKQSGHANWRCCSKMQQMARKSEILAPISSQKPEQPEATSQKPAKNIPLLSKKLKSRLSIRDLFVVTAVSSCKEQPCTILNTGCKVV